MYSLTIFKSIFDNKTHRRMDFSDWESFEKLFYDLSARNLKGKKDAELISPAIYTDGTTRANKNVIHWAGWAAVDVDDFTFEGDLRDQLGSIIPDWYYICYSTASSTVDTPKFRLLFKLNRHVGTDDIRHFWHALNSELGSIGDKQTKDLSRMYYTPARYSNANNFIFTRTGDAIDVDALLSKHPFVKQNVGDSFLDRLPEELQKQVIEHRKQKLENKNKYTWNGLHDCPFVNKKMIAEYKSITQTGWYHKMYQFMVSVSFNAIRNGYPITDIEIEKLARELDAETGNWYERRPIRGEANSALNYAYKNSEV